MKELKALKVQLVHRPSIFFLKTAERAYEKKKKTTGDLLTERGRSRAVELSSVDKLLRQTSCIYIFSQKTLRHDGNSWRSKSQCFGDIFLCLGCFAKGKRLCQFGFCSHQVDRFVK